MARSRITVDVVCRLTSIVNSLLSNTTIQYYLDKKDDKWAIYLSNSSDRKLVFLSTLRECYVYMNGIYCVLSNIKG